MFLSFYIFHHSHDCTLTEAFRRNSITGQTIIQVGLCYRLHILCYTYIYLSYFIQTSCSIKQFSAIYNVTFIVIVQITLGYMFHWLNLNFIKTWQKMFMSSLCVIPHLNDFSLCAVGMESGGSLSRWLNSDIFIVFVVLLLLLLLVIFAVCWLMRRHHTQRSTEY